MGSGRQGVGGRRLIASSERGSVLALFALWVPVLLLLLALVIDGSNWYVYKRKVQAAADAAATTLTPATPNQPVAWAEAKKYVDFNITSGQCPSTRVRV